MISDLRSPLRMDFVVTRFVRNVKFKDVNPIPFDPDTIDTVSQGC
jgi:hypothetical protein